MKAALLKSIVAYPELIKILDLHGIERAAAGFEIMLAASRDDRGHFYSPDGAPCPHKKGENNGKGQKLLNLPDGFKAVPLKCVYDRIGKENGEIVKASDGKPARFSKKAVRHFRRKNKFERIKRLKSLDVAQDTVKNGDYFKSYIPGTKIIQTEFIKNYGNKFYYTARRDDTGEIYSWHELEKWQFNKKMKAYKNYNATGKIQ